MQNNCIYKNQIKGFRRTIGYKKFFFIIIDTGYCSVRRKQCAIPFSSESVHEKKHTDNCNCKFEKRTMNLSKLSWINLCHAHA